MAAGQLISDQRLLALQTLEIEKWTGAFHNLSKGLILSYILKNRSDGIKSELTSFIDAKRLPDWLNWTDCLGDPPAAHLPLCCRPGGPQAVRVTSPPFSTATAGWAAAECPHTARADIHDLTQSSDENARSLLSGDHHLSTSPISPKRTG